MSKGMKNLFVSHVHEDDEDVTAVKELLGRSGYQVRDGSIVSSKPNQAKNEEYIKYEILAPRIDWAGTLVVLISPDTHTSKWVNWEIEYAERHDKRIVGVYVRGGQRSDLPENFERYGEALVGWQAQRVIDAIDGRIDGWQTPEGDSIARDRKIERYSCS